MNDRRHWADEEAAAAAARGGTQVLSTGISPSGPIHVGNMRESLTADAVLRALQDAGAPARLNFVADDYDPLRRVYPFLEADRYEPLVGKPLCAIPCPCGDHASYADHFLDPYLVSLARLRVDAELIRAHELYASGRMNEPILRALEERDRIASIQHELTGKDVAPDWSPFNPLCPDCGRIDRGVVEGFSRDSGTVRFRCDCGFSGARPLAEAGKLTWRVDWPARWWALGVTLEPFGKDHATRGGSYDTGSRIAREVFGQSPPHPVAYEWISLKGMGDMAGSKGNVITVSEALEVVPPEALRYLVIRARPGRAISLDPGLPLLSLVDELDNPEAKNRDERAVALSQAGGFEATGVPFKHLVVVAQIGRFDVERVTGILERGGYPAVSRPALEERMAYARRWLERFAPDDVRFEVPEALPDAAGELDEAQKTFLGDLAARLEEGQDGQTVHGLIYEIAKERGLEVPLAFRAVYLAVLGRPRGPRAGDFLSFLGAEFSKARLAEAASL